MANRIALELIADANPFNKAMEQAQKTLNRFMDASNDAGHAIGGGLGKALDNFQNFAKGGASAAGILAGGFAAAAAGAVALTASAGRQVEALDKLSQKTGISMNTLQNWSVVMAENDLQAESLTAAMRTLSKNMVEAKDPASKAALAFEQAGISVKDFGSTESVIRAISDRFKEMPDGPEKARIAIEFLGRSGLDLIPVLNRGSAALDESALAAQRFAANLSTLQEKSLKEADDALDRLGVAATSLKQNLASVFAPAVQKGAEVLAEVMGTLAHWAKAVDTALDTLAIRLTHIALAGKEIGKVLFSGDALNSDAWKQALTNISLIDKEAAKLIAKRRALDDLAPEEISTPEVQVVDTQFSAEQERQMALGKQLLGQHLHALHLQKAEQNAQEALGRVIVQMTQSKLGALTSEEKAQEALGRTLLQIHQRQRDDLGKELDLYFETEQKLSVITDQEAAGAAIVQQATEAWKHRNDALEMAVDRAKVLDEAEQQRAQTELSLFGQSRDAINARMQLIDAEGALRKRVIEESIFDERRRKEALVNLDIELDTKRRQIIQSYPSFYQKQLQAIEQSNSFSIALISNTWTSGLANAIVNGGNFAEQALKSTQVALLQAVMNFAIQKLAVLAAMAAQEIAIEATLAASKMSVHTATNASIVASTAATAGATTSIWAGAGAAIIGTFGTITGAISLFFTATIIPMFAAIGEAIMVFLSAVATSLDISIFGAPFSIPIWLAVGLIGAAVGAIAAFAFADGGIVTGPTMGMVGEAGSSEAVIPLNKRGAAFMREAVGGGTSGGQTTLIVELDGRPIARSVFDHMPGVMRVRGIAA